MLADEISARLTTALQPLSLQVIDNSPQHLGHAGTAMGGGHYQVCIVSAAFEGKPLVRRHQLIYQALGDMMRQQIHALGIEALAPSETDQ